MSPINQSEIIANEQLITDSLEKVLSYLEEHGVEVDKMSRRSIRNNIRSLLKTLPDLKNMTGEEIANNLVGIALIDSLRMQLMQKEEEERSRALRERKAQKRAADAETSVPAEMPVAAESESPATKEDAPKEQQKEDASLSAARTDDETSASAPKAGKKEGTPRKKTTSRSLTSLYGNRQTVSVAEMRKKSLDYANRIKKLRNECQNHLTYLNLFCEDSVVLSAIPEIVKKNPDLVNIPGHDLSTMKGVFHYAIACMAADLEKKAGEDSDLIAQIMERLDAEFERQEKIREEIVKVQAEYELYKGKML